MSRVTKVGNELRGFHLEKSARTTKDDDYLRCALCGRFMSAEIVKGVSYNYHVCTGCGAYNRIGTGQRAFLTRYQEGDDAA